jgi:hypothetical protein
MFCNSNFNGRYWAIHGPKLWGPNRVPVCRGPIAEVRISGFRITEGPLEVFIILTTASVK